MDTRTGKLYETEAAAVNAGVPRSELAQVQVRNRSVTVTSGPFRGRVYDVSDDGRRGRRRRDLEGAAGDPAENK